MKLTVNTVGIDGCEIADRRDSSMRNGAREVDTIVGTLVRYRVHSNFILPQEQMGPWHLEGFVFVVASVRLHGARPWHLRKISGGFL